MPAKNTKCRRTLVKRYLPCNHGNIDRNVGKSSRGVVCTCAVQCFHCMAGHVMLCIDSTPCAEVHVPESTSQCTIQAHQWSFTALSMLVNVLSVGYKHRSWMFVDVRTIFENAIHSHLTSIYRSSYISHLSSA
jgi:hypothetical protein